jgi:hypothetical protein
VLTACVHVRPILCRSALRAHTGDYSCGLYATVCTEKLGAGTGRGGEEGELGAVAVTDSFRQINLARETQTAGRITELSSGRLRCWGL